MNRGIEKARKREREREGRVGGDRNSERGERKERVR